jgi:membrane-associated phospholipid phosphatase
LNEDDKRRRALLALIACAVLVPASVLLLDRPVATFAHDRLARPAVLVWLTYIADVPVPAALLGLAAAGFAWLAGWRPGAAGRAVLAACVATLLAIEIKNELKLGFGRLWPDTWTHANPSWIHDHRYGFFPFHGGAGWGSFPSGHTTAITAPCAALYQKARRWRPLWVALPVLVAVGLVGADYHFLGDCLAGAFLGVAVAAFVCAWF